MMFADPENNIKQFALKDGAVVADLGAGSGFYTFAAARAVGPSGLVYAVDIDTDLLRRIKDEAGERELKNIEIIPGDLEKVGGTKLADSFADAVLVSNILFQVTNKDALIKEVQRILKPDGRVLVIDWKDSFGGLGPEKKAIVPEVAARDLFEIHNFEFEREISAGEHHYGIIFKKNV
ncbi:MAG TPA: methyltransferase domain-containing protein [Candidatus Paceibacterota bacterium]